MILRGAGACAVAKPKMCYDVAGVSDSPGACKNLKEVHTTASRDPLRDRTFLGPRGAVIQGIPFCDDFSPKM